MRMNSETREVETFGAQSTTTFGFHQSSKLVTLFYDGMYSDKIGSIVRELMSNAFDAHVEAGIKDKPFHIKVPTNLDSTFKIRDYGNGLSKDFMRNKYTLIGLSTKDQSNDQVGGWGWGRLSPLSYVDSYNVTSYQNGLATYWTIYINKEKHPDIMFVGEKVTNEPDGFEVMFPVKRENVQEFYKKLNFYGVGFDVKPTGFQFEKNKVVLEGKNWKQYQPSYGSPYFHNYIKMGCVVYQLKDNFDAFDRSLRGFVVDVPIGSVSVTVSREDISYDEPTKKYLIKVFSEIKQTIVDSVLKSIESANSEYEAVKKLKNISLPYSLTTDIEKKATWNKAPIKKVLDSPLSVKNYRYYSFNSGRPSATFEKIIFPEDNLSFYVVVNYSDKTNNIRRDQRVVKRIKADNPPGSVCVIFIQEDADWKSLKELKKRLGDKVTVKNVSDLPDTPPKRSIASKVINVYSYRQGYKAEPLDLDLDKEKGYYVKTYNNIPRKLSREDLTLIPKFNELGFIDKKIVSAPKSLWKKFEDNKNWVEYSPKLFEHRFDWGEIKKVVEAKEVIIGHNLLHLDLRKINDPAVNQSQTAKATYLGKDKRFWKNFADLYGKTFKEDVIDVYNYLKKNYPLIKVLGHYYVNKTEIIQYINMVYAYNQMKGKQNV